MAAPSAQSVTLCLFDEVGLEEKVRLPMPSVEDGVWSGYLPDASPGLVYAYRVSGEYAPEKGLRYNANKVLLDPYARQVIATMTDRTRFPENRRSIQPYLH